MGDSDYFAQREQSALHAAERASTPAIRNIHLTLAAAYRQRRSGDQPIDGARGNLRIV